MFVFIIHYFRFDTLVFVETETAYGILLFT